MLQLESWVKDGFEVVNGFVKTSGRRGVAGYFSESSLYRSHYHSGRRHSVTVLCTGCLERYNDKSRNRSAHAECGTLTCHFINTSTSIHVEIFCRSALMSSSELISVSFELDSMMSELSGNDRLTNSESLD